MRISLSTIYFLFFFSVYCLFFVIIINTFPNLESARSGFQFTSFDSMMFYDLARNSSVGDIISGEGLDLLAYRGYPIYLITCVEIFNYLNIDVNYKILLCSNLIIIGLLWVMYTKVMSVKNKPIAYVFILFAVFEPSIFGFSLTLERELFLSFFLGLICFSYLKLKGIYKYIVLFFAFFVLFNLRVEVLFIVFLSLLLFNLRKIIANQTSTLKKYSLLIFGWLFILSVFTYLAIDYGDFYLNFMELQLDNSPKGGFGGKILAMPLPIRIIVYSILYFFLPFPSYGIFMQELVFPYEVFISISSISYLFLWGYILKNIKFLKGNSILVLIICLIGHIVLGGSLFNYRHRVDLIVPLSILVLHIINFKLVNMGFTVKALLKEIFTILSLSVLSIILLSFLLYVIL